MGNIERSEDDYMPISERWPDGVVPMGEYENVLERARLAEGVADSLHEQLRGAVGALRGLHTAGQALVPHLPFMRADVVTRWDEAMGAADDFLGGQ